VNNNYNYLYS